MAMPLEPESGLFPDTLQEPFVRAPELEELAELVIAQFSEFEPIAQAIREEGLTIEYVWETKAFDPLKDEFKPHTIAKVTKASPLWRCLTDRHLVIQFREAFWKAFRDEQRRAVLHHELTHIEVEVDEQHRLKVSLREHDVEDFTRTIRRFGPVLPGRAGFMKAFLDWQHEQDRPEPTPLRRIGEALVDEVERDGDAAQGLRDLAEETGTDVTITAGDRSVTIEGKGRRRARDIADETVATSGLTDPAIIGDVWRAAAEAAGDAAAEADFGGLLREGETPAKAIRRLEKRADYAKLIGTDDGQRLLEAADAERGRRQDEPEAGE
jgi:hypothetical protein